MESPGRQARLSTERWAPVNEERELEATRPTPEPSLHQVPLTRVADVDQGDGGRVDLRVGQRLGPFELRELLGAGGMGQVFLAEQLRPVQRQVALKFMQQRLAGGQAVARFEIERQALARMSHPAIAQVFEAGTTADGFPYLAMEYVPGEPIHTWCRQRQLDLAARVRLFIDVARGVQHAHQKNILHLDLKPANLLVTEVDGRAHPKIIDFGLAMSLARIPGQKRAWAQAGTPGYMSPEQAGIGVEVEGADVDARSDVYALGVVLHQLLAGAPPFAPGQFSECSSEVLRAHFEHHPLPPPSQRLLEAGDRRAARRVAGDLDAIVARACDRHAGRRYESVAELVDDLQRWLEYRPVRARPATRGLRLRLYLRRNRLQVGIAALLALALAGGLATALWGLQQARRERDLATARQQELERVSEFQQRMLAGIDPAALGQGLQGSLRGQLEAALKAQPDATPQLAAFERQLALANPTEAARRLIDEDLLRRALAAIDGEFTAQPQVAAELRLAIARAYLGIGLPGPALDAIDLALPQLAGMPRSLQARLERAAALKQLGRGREALPELARLVADGEAAGDADVALAGALAQVEIEALEGGRLADSLPVARALLERHEAHYGADALESIGALQVLAALVARNDGLEAAAPMLQRAFEVLERRLGADHPRAIAALEMLANNTAVRGDPQAALPLHRRAYELRRRVHGNEHPLTLQAQNSLAITLSTTGDLPGAVAMGREVLELRTRTLGRDHPQTLRTMLNLGAFLARSDDIEGATAITRECYQRRRAVLGPDNPDLYTAGQNLADFELIRGNVAEAWRLAEESLQGRLRLLGEQHGETRRTLPLVGRTAAAAGEHARAIPLLRAQLAEEQERDATRALAAWYLARALRDAGDNAEAERLLAAHAPLLLAIDPADLAPPELHVRRQLQASPR